LSGKCSLAIGAGGLGDVLRAEDDKLVSGIRLLFGLSWERTIGVLNLGVMKVIWNLKFNPCG
jgi:hypothetical protein